MSAELKPSKWQLQQQLQILSATIRTGEANVPRCWLAMKRIQKQIAALDTESPRA